MSRLEVAIAVSMFGYLADFSITHWMINILTGFSESNTTLLPQVGLPLMVLNFLVADRLLPNIPKYNNVMYTMALLQWSGPLQNILVFTNITQGLDFFSVVIPFIGLTYLTLYVSPLIGNQLKLIQQKFFL